MRASSWILELGSIRVSTGMRVGLLEGRGAAARLVLQPQRDVVALLHRHGRWQDNLHLHDVARPEVVRPDLRSGAGAEQVTAAVSAANSAR